MQDIEKYESALNLLNECTHARSKCTSVMFLSISEKKLLFENLNINLKVVQKQPIVFKIANDKTKTSDLISIGDALAITLVYASGLPVTSHTNAITGPLLLNPWLGLLRSKKWVPSHPSLFDNFDKYRSKINLDPEVRLNKKLNDKLISLDITQTHLKTILERIETLRIISLDNTELGTIALNWALSPNRHALRLREWMRLTENFELEPTRTDYSIAVDNLNNPSAHLSFVVRNLNLNLKVLKRMPSSFKLDFDGSSKDKMSVGDGIAIFIVSQTYRQRPEYIKESLELLQNKKWIASGKHVFKAMQMFIERSERTVEKALSLVESSERQLAKVQNGRIKLQKRNLAKDDMVQVLRFIGDENQLGKKRLLTSEGGLGLEWIERKRRWKE